MSAMGGALAEVLAFTPEAFASLASDINTEWIQAALAQAKDFGEMRRRRLPLDRALWLVVGMGLFRDRSIQEVVEHLDLTLPDHGENSSAVAPSAIVQARQRLGEDPVVHLFELTAGHWSVEAAAEKPWRGLKLYAVDGSCLRVPDTAENDAEFGRPTSARNRGRSGYPQIRMVGLMAARSHVLAGVSVGAYHTGEQTLLVPLMEKVPERSLTMFDRGFLSWWALWRIHQGNERHWLIRAKKNLKWRRVKKLGPGDELVEIEVPRSARKEHPEMPATIQARVLACHQQGYRPYRVVTSMIDAEKYPAAEVRELYRERWEVELGYDEVKTHLLEREEALRSKTPAGVRQEMAGIAIAYNLVRMEMARVAKELGVEPTRISFRHSLLLIRNFCLTAWNTAPGNLPRRLGDLERDMSLLVLPPRRTGRRYKRHVKIKMSNYARNRGKRHRRHRTPKASGA